ncbi:Fe-S cluster assembly protein SufD [Dulcicalothrix desertica PCC 7102]|uniref:Fe-S cluster assembly protein SufD n=1 Tax=Dulcicalothrix desertica PCC 7102 TaxID=232991 RepID=A0A3S1ANF5_9CYAN|nr:Fe-S cluster assembly protein SufD [Dulcicalothrix desertica]RUT05112.1 Fe-S cluster assembly protein SufD [Dulcicalothrix desertica PCC 7102]TWH43379.1 Fe-S cluster assembly protein SufD [Dulcicalothrix desertica PCC 7102]
MITQVSPSPIPNSNVVSLTSTLLDRDNYLTELLNNVVVGETQHWLQEIKQRAANSVRHSTLPTNRDEEWRFTDLSKLKQINFKNAAVETLHVTSLQPQILPEAQNSRLVFINGIYAPELSAVSDLPEGILVTNLVNLPEEYTVKAQEYLAQAEGALEVFTALNTAGMQDAAVIWVSKNVVVETPVHLVYITAGEGAISLPRCLVVANTGSQVSFVEEYVTGKMPVPQEGSYFTNAVTEIWISDNASVSHTRVQKEDFSAFHVGKTAVTQARYSRYTCNAINIGASLGRHNLEILQTGEQTETTLNGLAMIKGIQVADMHSAIALNHPNGVCKQLQKNIVGDKAHAIFNGKVFVPKPAQQTDAAQLNRNLMLTSKARVDTKPQLEITADNVKCAHGATVSQLEDDEIFYLQSRGIDENSSRHLLINAFATEIINNISVTSLRDNLLNEVKQF